MRNLVIAAGLLMLAGCSDPQKATEKNFESAMQSYLDTAYPRCYFSSNFPVLKAEFDFVGRNAGQPLKPSATPLL